MFSNDNIVRICPDGIITVTEDGKIARVNAAAEALLGWTESEMVGSRIEMVMPDEVSQDDLAIVPDFPGRPSALVHIANWRQIEAQRRDGTHIPVNVWVAGETRDGVRHTAIFLRDMSEIAGKQTEVEAARGELELVRGHNELLALVAEHATDIVIITDAQGLTMWVNAYTELLTGYLASEFIGRTPGSVLQGPASDPAVIAELSLAVKTGEPIRREIVNYTKAGEPYWIDMIISPIHDARGRLQKFIAVQRDVTAAKQRGFELEAARATAERAEQRLHAAIMAMAEGFSIYDEHDRLVMANAAFRNFRADDAEFIPPGITFEQMCRNGLRLGYFDTEGKTDEEWLAIQIEARRLPGGAETYVRFADGRWMLRRDRHTPQGELISIRTDVTAIKQHEQELSEARERAEAADRAKSDFVAMISHEIRTPISGIMGFNALMLAGELSSVQRERAEIVQESSEHLLQLVNNVLDLSKIVADGIELEAEPIGLVELVSGTILSLAQLADQKGLSLSSHLDVPPEICVVGDAGSIKQILINLIGNAIKFTAQGSVRLTVSEDRGGFLFEIADTGGGIPESKLKMIFDRFSQLGSLSDRAQGVGLGLSITKRLTEMMRGTIDVSSEAGQGSVFSVWLPLPRLAGSGEAAPETGPAVGHGAEASEGEAVFDVLVAEDHLLNQRLIFEILDSIGCRVAMAETGQAALDRLDAADFDLIIMDNQMPVMTGMEAIEIIRARSDWKMGIPIIALTANAMRGAEKTYKAIGVNEFITKPLNVQQVVAAVKRLAELGRKLRKEAHSGDL